MNPISNLFADIPTPLPEELCTTLLQAKSIRVERIISHGHTSPEGFWYDQEQHEWVLLLHGAARVQFEDGEVELKPGAYVNIPAHQRHRVSWTDPDQVTIWLALHYAAESLSSQASLVAPSLPNSPFRHLVL